jgi:hypothetical protein
MKDLKSSYQRLTCLNWQRMRWVTRGFFEEMTVTCIPSECIEVHRLRHIICYGPKAGKSFYQFKEDHCSWRE